MGQSPSPSAQVSTFPALLQVPGAGAGASRLCCVLSLGTARGHLSPPGVCPASHRDRARAPQTHQGCKEGCGAVGVLPQPLHLLLSPPSCSLLCWTGHLSNSFCKPGWNKELSPHLPGLALPCLVPALCLGHSGFLHFWERVVDDKWKCIPSAREFLGHSKPRAPRLLPILGHKEAPEDSAPEELSE